MTGYGRSLGAVGFLAMLASAPALAQGTPASEQPCSRLWGADRPCRPDYVLPLSNPDAAQRRPWERQQPALSTAQPEPPKSR